MNEYPITATELSALRQADQVRFASSWDHEGTPSARIEAVKEIKTKASDPWGDHEKVVAVPCSTTIHAFQGWTKKHDCEFRPRAADEDNRAAMFWPEWQTLVTILRPGDCLRLDWEHGAGSEELELAGFSTDSLAVTVDRPAKGRNKPKQFTLLLCKHSTKRVTYVRGSWILRKQKEAA